MFLDVVKDVHFGYLGFKHIVNTIFCYMNYNDKY